MTVEPLLSTKLQAPMVRPNTVSRPRLVARLAEGLRLVRRLTLVSAPPGVGARRPGSTSHLCAPAADRAAQRARAGGAAPDRRGLSNQEIADRLIIARGTVKRHINNIYGKLQVGSRTQAVAAARDLHIL